MVKQLLNSIRVVYKFAPGAAIIKFLQIAVTASMAPLSLFFTQKLIDCIFPYMSGKIPLSTVILWSLLLLVTIMISTSTNLINTIQEINIQRKLNGGFTQSVLNKFKKIDYSCFEDNNIQDTLNRMGNSPQDKILEIFLGVIDVISQVITIIGCVVIFTQVSIWFSLNFIIILLVMMRLDFKAANMVNSMFNSQTEEERRMSYYSKLLNDKNSLFELKVFGAIGYITSKWRNTTKNVLNERLRTTIISQKYFAISSGFVLLWIAVIVSFLILSLENNKISFGLFVSLIGSAGSVIGVTNTLSNSCSTLSQKFLQMKHYDIFNNLPEIIDNEDVSEELIPHIVFDNVWFKYPKTDKPVLCGVSFKIKPNECIAIVGENGAGKSTIIKLLCRLYKPDSGRITIDGKDINSLSRKQLKQVISVVFQDYVNYSLTLRENVAFGDINELRNDEAIRTALKQSMAEDIYNELDMNLGKIEEDGVDLSGGQWQRIAIARAFITSSHFIVLDEPTAALDPIVESEMYETFTKVLSDRGCIIISHRLASARMADKVIVINKGKVAEVGSHEELLEKDSIYKEMWEVQSKWYKVGELHE